MTIRIGEMRAEFARRKVQFYANEKVEDIRLWGLFSWGTISKYLKDGRVIANPGYTKENETIWCKPSLEEWKQHIEPLTKTKTLKELTTFAGW